MATGQYDDAWETSGWTAQNMAYPPGDSGSTPPAGVYPVDVTGAFFSEEGAGYSGILTFVPVVRQVVLSGTVVTFDDHRVEMTGGSFTERLYIPIDQQFTYHVRQRVGPVNKQYDIVLNSTMTTYDISAAQ